MVSEEELKEIKTAQAKNREEQLKQNRAWLTSLRSYYYSGYDLDDYNKYDELIDSLSIEDIQATAKKYFNENNVVKIVLKPEE